MKEHWSPSARWAGPRGRAFGVNDAGIVVGGSTTVPGQAFGQSGSHAFVWHAGVMRDVNDLGDAAPGWELIGALAINDDGYIVGRGLHDGDSHALLLTPLPQDDGSQTSDRSHPE